jgi:acyl-CoA thioesterase-2
MSLHAAAATVPAGMHPWSLHMYFHAPVRANEPADFGVERVKQGRTLATRRVLVEQQGSLRASATVLFGVAAEGPGHQYAPPPTIPAEHLPARERLVDPSILPVDADWQALGYPEKALVDLRLVPAQSDEYNSLSAWMRVLPDLPDDPLTTACTVAYLSDMTLGSTALEPHGGRAELTDLQLGALELALWFTGPANLSEWTLFAMYSAFAGGGHGLAHGIFYNSEGGICAVALQNALMRHQ